MERKKLLLMINLLELSGMYIFMHMAKANKPRAIPIGIAALSKSSLLPYLVEIDMQIAFPKAFKTDKKIILYRRSSLRSEPKPASFIT